MDENNQLFSVLPSGYFGHTSDKIFTVQNLLSEDEIERLLFVAKNMEIWKDSPFRNKYSDQNKIKELAPDVYEMLNDIRQRWQKHVSDFFNVEIETYDNPICEWIVGGSQRPHADKEWEDGSPGDQNHYDIGSVIYLNDDYEGGEIYFPEHGLTIKPERGSATAFPGDLFFMHGVKEVKNISRYTLPMFWTVLKYEREKDQSGNDW